MGVLVAGVVRVFATQKGPDLRRSSKLPRLDDVHDYNGCYHGIQHPKAHAVQQVLERAEVKENVRDDQVANSPVHLLAFLLFGEIIIHVEELKHEVGCHIEHEGHEDCCTTDEENVRSVVVGTCLSGPEEKEVGDEKEYCLVEDVVSDKVLMVFVGLGFKGDTIDEYGKEGNQEKTYRYLDELLLLQAAQPLSINLSLPRPLHSNIAYCDAWTLWNASFEIREVYVV